MNDIYLLTSNPGKIAAAKAIFQKFNIGIKALELEVPEIQAGSSQVIAAQAALEAHKQTGQAVIREDHSFYIDDLHMPGPFMAYIDKAITVDQLLKIIDTLPTRNGHFELAAAYVDLKGSVHEFSYIVPVKLAMEARGDTAMRWEQIIHLPEESRTFAEYPESERAGYWTKNYESIAGLISSTQTNQ